MNSMTKKEAMAKRYLTLDDLRRLDFDMLTPAIAAKYLRCAPYSITVQAHECKEKLGYPVIITNRRVKIPRIGFINYMEGKQ